MKRGDFSYQVNSFLLKSLVDKTTQSVLLISTDGTNMSCLVDCYPAHIRDAMATLLRDNPRLIKAMDGACRRARAMIKERQEDEELHASG